MFKLKKDPTITAKIKNKIKGGNDPNIPPLSVLNIELIKRTKGISHKVLMIFKEVAVIAES